VLANRLTQITLKFVSLVSAGANRREFVAKADGTVGFDIEARVVKVDDALREVSGALYPAGQVDTQGDFATQADFNLAMLDFQAKGRGAAGIACDCDHDENPTTDFISEVYRTVENDPRWPSEEPGTWIVTRKITDDARWQAVLDGTYKAFSFGGTAVRIPNQPVTKTDDPAAPVRRFAEALKKGLLADRMARLEVPHLLDAACGAMWDAYYGSPADTAEERAAVAAVVAELTAELNKESSMDKTLLQKLAESIADLFRKAAEETPAPEATPEPEPAVKSVEETVAEAVEAAKTALSAEHEAAVEALKADFTAQLQAKDDEIERLGKLAPSSERVGHNGKGDDEVSGGGVFAGRVQ